MLFDTDILIWALRGNHLAAKEIDHASDKRISTISYMELIKGARDKRELRLIKSFLKTLNFETIPVDTNISHRALIYMEEHALSSGLDLADALIAATAAELSLEICTANTKHYRFIPEISIRKFHPN